MASKVDICNLALASVGTRSTITNLNESSAEARQLKLQYPNAVDAILQAAHWNFARAQKALSLLKDATISPPDNVPAPWCYEYDFPSDCIQARYIMPQYVNGPAVVSFTIGPAVPFLVSTDFDISQNRKKVILTNQPQANLVYTARIDDSTLFDGQFVQALAAYLGALVCIPLNGDKTLMKLAWAKADAITKDARASNGNEGLTVNDHVPDWIRVRGYASDWAYPPGSIGYYYPQNLVMVQ